MYVIGCLNKSQHGSRSTGFPFKVLVTTVDALGHFKQDNYSTMGEDGGCRVGEV